MQVNQTMIHIQHMVFNKDNNITQHIQMLIV